MKILIAHYKFYMQGGPERYLFKFMELARKNGAEVIPFSVNYPSNEPSEYQRFFVGGENAGGNYDAGNHSLSYLLEGAYHEFHNREAYRRVKALIREVRPDVMYVLIPGQLTPDIFRAAKEEGVPVVHRISDMRLLCGKNLLLRDGMLCHDCIQGDYRPMVKHRCVKGSKALSMLRAASCAYHRARKSYDAVDAVITPPEFTKRLLVESGFFRSEKVFVNPTFIDCGAVEPRYEAGDYVLCLGRFSEEKGFRYVVEAMQYLKDLPVAVAVTGTEAESPEELKLAVRELGLENKLRYLGFLKGQALTDAIRNAMCVACPSICYDNFPNVVIEAYACGKPVIASRLGSLPEIVEDGKTGYTFAPKNRQEIARCIRTLYENPERCRELGRNARRAAEEKYAPQAHWQRFLEIARRVGVTE